VLALTISQPYASLIASGEKWIENRRWETKYRGPLAIHAGKGTQYLDRKQLTGYPTGVVAVASMVACFRIADLDRLGDQLATVGLTVEAVRQHEHAEGPWCWLLRDVRRLRVPCPCSGAQGLWRWEPSVQLEFAG
jgi:activating signal cointegrator 1